MHRRREDEWICGIPEKIENWLHNCPLFPSIGLLLTQVSLLTDIVFQEVTECLRLSLELRGMIEFSCCSC